MLGRNMCRTRITTHIGRSVGVDVTNQFYAFFLSLEHEHVTHAFHTGLDVKVEVLQCHLACFKFAEVQDIVHLEITKYALRSLCQEVCACSYDAQKQRAGRANGIDQIALVGR